MCHTIGWGAHRRHQGHSQCKWREAKIAAGGIIVVSEGQDRSGRVCRHRAGSFQQRWGSEGQGLSPAVCCLALGG